MKNLLFVSIAFPPKSDPECLQVAKCAKYLSKTGEFNIEVITSSIPTRNMPYDPDLETYTQGISSIQHIELDEHRIKDFVVAKVAPSKLESPDRKFRFHQKWKLVTSKLTQIPDVIYSRSNPLSSAVLAMKLKKHYNKPWVMHLSDPWADNPLHKTSPKGQKINQTLEKECFSAADMITLTSEKTVDHYKKKYPEYKNKLALHPNTFDPDDFIPNEDIKWGEKLRIVYTGGLVGTRIPTPLFKALEFIESTNASILDKIEIIFAGHLDRSTQQLFDSCKFSCVRHLGNLNFSSAIELQRNSHVLLVIDSRLQNKNEAMFFPSKILDYMTAQRAIIAITDKSSTTAHIIKGNNLGNCFTHDEHTLLGQQMIRLYEEHLKKEKSTFFKRNLVDDLSAEKNALILADRLKSL